ncbi:hypothetical protein L1987_51033 [Smallanthus sonchifolius]|uniref:Uncharacterized protein n=1 Tax=Smallanthus sonchifolius TaxID=185202 RepID=A0ACB9EP90_9ASTR|nr:hypothetical protein L1987_51033 [Smallanthus sonchifolius]
MTMSTGGRWHILTAKIVADDEISVADDDAVMQDFYTRFEVTFVISPSPPSSLLFSSLMTNEFTHSYLTSR